MKIYLAHSRDFDFKTKLYPALEHALRSHRLTVPYKDGVFSDSKKHISSSDLIIAEVSVPSTGVGIELGWANMLQIPIMAIHKKGTKVSSSVQMIAKYTVQYTTSEDLASKITVEINKIE